MIIVIAGAVLTSSGCLKKTEQNKAQEDYTSELCPHISFGLGFHDSEKRQRSDIRYPQEHCRSRASKTL